MQVESRPDGTRAFIDLPYVLHGSDRRWIPPPRGALQALLERDHPAHDRGTWRHFMIPGQGRVSAVHLRDSTLGLLGSFECVPSYEVAGALLEAGRAWLAERGVTTIRGPMHGDTWHSYRFVTGPFEDPPFLLEPDNPPCYPEFWERFGFRPCATFTTLRHDNLPAVVRALEPYHARALRSGYRFRRLDLAKFDAELGILHELCLAIFADNPGFLPIGFDEFKALYSGSRAIMDPDLSYLALDRTGIPVGFLFGLPDHAAAVRAMRGSANLAAKLRFLAARRKPAGAILKTLGVVPRVRGSSVAYGLGYAHHHGAMVRGYRYGLQALMADSNVSLKMSAAKGSQVFRRYALYEYRLC